MFVLHDENERSLHVDDMVEMVQVLVNLVIDILYEMVVMVEMVQIDDKLYISIKNEHQNKYL